MARKLKFKPKFNKSGLGLFDFDNGSASAELSMSQSLDVKKDESPVAAVTDFTVNIVSPVSKPLTHSEYVNRMTIDTSGLNTSNIITFMSFGSGSSGNCSYIGDSTGGFLIDAGVDFEHIRDGLKANGLSFDKIKGICLTHDHSDHVRFVYSIVRKHPNIGVYCTPKTLSGIMRRHSISRRLKDYHRPIYKEFAFKIGDFEITAFDVSHDGTDNSGFFIRRGEHTMAVATDLGHISDRVAHYMRQARYIVLESNYDADMLSTGSYPMHLKARIAADNGHLDNADAARFLAEIVSPQLSHVFLCHVSKDNNTPELALRTVKDALVNAGVAAIGDASESIESRACPIQVMVLPRYDSTRLFTFR